jgi:hypothetical protein
VLYTVIFAGLAILAIGVVLFRNLRSKGDRGGSETTPDTSASARAAHSDAGRQERKRRRAQSKKDRRKRH